MSCEYCDGSGKRMLESDLEGHAYIEINNDGHSYFGSEFVVCDSNGITVAFFEIEYCPKCGCDLSGDVQ